MVHFIRPGAPRTVNLNDCCNRCMGYPTILTDFRSFLELCNVSRLFLQNFAQDAQLLHDKLRKSQLLTFHGLTNHEISALERLKGDLMEHLCFGSSMFAMRLWSRYGCLRWADWTGISARSTFKEPTDEQDIGHICYITPRAHTNRRNKNYLQ